MEVKGSFGSHWTSVKVLAVSMDHKSYLFDWRLFKQELRPLLEASLADRDTCHLELFIKSNLALLTDPATEQALSSDWHQDHPKDVQVFGDIALTKYYDIRNDIGLTNQWKRICSDLEAIGGNSEITLGFILGTADCPFDPGKMGSYFQSLGDVSNNANLLEEWLARKPGFTDRLGALREMLRKALQARKGLYITF
jgi:hypothetical protein